MLEERCYVDIEQDVLSEMTSCGPSVFRLLVYLIKAADDYTGLLRIGVMEKKRISAEIGMSLRTLNASLARLVSIEVVVPLSRVEDSYGVSVSSPGIYALNPTKIWKGDDSDLHAVTMWKVTNFDSDGNEKSVRYEMDYKGMSTFIPESIIHA